MVRRVFYALFVPAAGAAAYFLRTQQLAEGFEAASGFAVRGDRWQLYLWGTAAIAFLLSLILSLFESRSGAFGDRFGSAAGVPFQWIGIAALLGSAVWRARLVFPEYLSIEFILGAAEAAAALCLIPAAVLRGKSGRTPGAFLLLPMCAAIAELTFFYLSAAPNPNLPAYAPAILFLVLTALSAMLLCMLAFGINCTRRFLLASSLTVVIAGAALADAGTLTAMLEIAACAITCFGFFLSLLFPSKEQRASADESSGRKRVVPEALPEIPDVDFDISEVDRLIRELQD